MWIIFASKLSSFHIWLSSTKTLISGILLASCLYPTTVVTQSGVPFFGSCMPSGELFRIYFRGDLGGITSSFMTDVRVTLKDPSDVLPFDNLYHTIWLIFVRQFQLILYSKN